MVKTIIGIFGGGLLGKNSSDYQLAFETGRLLAEAGMIVLTGGLGGVMEAASKGAKEAGGITVGILPNNKGQTPRPNPYIDIPIFTGMGEARNAINVKSCDGAIAIGGEYGTLSEIALTLKVGCPLVLLQSWHLLPHEKKEAELTRATTAKEAVAHIKALVDNH